MTIPDSSSATVEVDAKVLVLIPEYHQVAVVTDDGREYSLTRHTQGVALSDLHVGQRVRCTVTIRLSRVLAAWVLE
jgi:hypothetical protein